jgi:hypothetical protein
MQNALNTSKRAIASWPFIVAATLMLLIIIIGAFSDIQALFSSETNAMCGFHNTALLSALESKIVLFALPILCAMPYASSLLYDLKSGYIKSVMVRCSKAEYIRSKGIAVCISGGLALFVGIMAAYLVFFLIFTPAEVIPPSTEKLPSMFGEVVATAMMFFLFGSLFSLLGALMAIFTMNKYMAYASPFIIYYVLVILNERYLKNMYVLNPQEWVNPQNEWMGGNWGITLLMLELITILFLLFYFCAQKRLKDV